MLKRREAFRAIVAQAAKLNHKITVFRETG